MKTAGIAILSGIATALILGLSVAVAYFYKENQKLTAQMELLRALSLTQEADQTRAKACSMNLMSIKTIMAAWSLDKNKSDDAQPTIADLIEYFPRGFPSCPSGGNYSVSRVKDDPECSIPTHSFKQAP